MNIINLLNLSFGTSFVEKLNYKDISALRETSKSIKTLLNLHIKENIKRTLKLDFDSETAGNPFLTMWKETILINEGIEHNCGHKTLKTQNSECIVCCESLKDCDECIKKCGGCNMTFCSQCSAKYSWNCASCGSDYCYQQCDFRNLKSCHRCSNICCQKCIIITNNYDDEAICKGCNPQRKSRTQSKK